MSGSSNLKGNPIGKIRFFEQSHRASQYPFCGGPNFLDTGFLGAGTIAPLGQSLPDARAPRSRRARQGTKAVRNQHAFSARGGNAAIEAV